METAGKDDMPEERRAQGPGDPGHPCRDSGKLVSTAFWNGKEQENRAAPAVPDAVSLITVLPEQLQSPLLTAEWEYRLGEIERGELAPDDFMAGISAMLQELVRTYQVIKGTEYLFTPPRVVVGKCPAAAEKLQKCKEASSVRQNLANLQFGKTTSGGAEA